MARTRATLALAVAAAAAVLVVSGGSSSDPRTPSALPGLPPPFLGTAVIGSGGRTAAVDAYGDIVDLRVSGPAGPAAVEVPADRQAAGSVGPELAIVARARLGGTLLPLWRADSVRQRYLPGTNVLHTVARRGTSRAVVIRAIGGAEAARADRRWVSRVRPLGPSAPRWARRMYVRSLLVLRALTDRHSGAVAAGARDGWAYVWPRDAATVAIALASAGYRPEARRVVRFLRRLDLSAAARFRGNGAPVDGRAAQGDAAGWVAAAARAAGLEATSTRYAWRGRSDYQERESGDYLANAIAADALADGPKIRLYGGKSGRRRTGGWIRRRFASPHGLVREAGNLGSGLDSAAAWAVRPFPHPALFPLVRRTLLRLAAKAGPYGIVPSQSWAGEDPWTAPTAWSAWSLATLGARRAALRLMADLHRAATPLGLLPERVDAQTGIPRSTTPLAWSHAFTILALRQLWPNKNRGG